MLGGSILAYLLWFHLLRVCGATAASAYHFLMPPIGMLFAWMVLGEHVAFRDLLGIVPVALGTTGEPTSLSPAERHAVVDVLAGVCRDRSRTLIVGAPTAEDLAALSRWPSIAAALVLVPPFLRPVSQSPPVNLVSRRPLPVSPQRLLRRKPAHPSPPFLRSVLQFPPLWAALQ